MTGDQLSSDPTLLRASKKSDCMLSALFKHLACLAPLRPLEGPVQVEVLEHLFFFCLGERKGYIQKRGYILSLIIAEYIAVTSAETPKTTDMATVARLYA